VAKTIEEAQDAYKAARRELIAATAGERAAEDASIDARIRRVKAEKLAASAKDELDAAIDLQADQLELGLHVSGAV
jgi:hypothetical protein